jgi:hypothetical protein
MFEEDEQNQQPPSTRLLIFAIAVTILTIATIVLIFVFNISSTEYFIVPIGLTIISLITASLLIRWKDLLALVRKLLHKTSFGTIERQLWRSKTSSNNQQFVSSSNNSSSLARLKALAQRNLPFSMSALLSILIILGICTLIYGYVNRMLPLIVIASISIVITILQILLILFLVEEKTRPVPTDTISYPPPPIQEDDTHILRKEIRYTYSSDGKTMSQYKHLQIKALKDDITDFIDRYRWTGSGKCILKSLTPGFRITRQFKVRGEIWNYFAVTFPQPLKKDDVVEFSIQWDLLDQIQIAIPFLSTMIERETDYLSLQVFLPSAPKRAYFYEFANFIDTLPVETKEIFWNPEDKSIYCEVPNPQKYHKYLIRWYANEN